MNLNNKVVIITGASSGVGHAAALAFARKGAKLVLAARRRERLDQLAERIKALGTDALSVQTDVTDQAQVKLLFERTVNEFARVDILVNNAGRGLKSRVEDMTLEDFSAVIKTNLTSVFLCSQQAILAMKEQKSGSIITVSSIAGKFAGPNYSAYCASKHAVTGFMKSLAWEAKRYGIKCTSLHPARIDTEFFDVYSQKPGKRQMLEADYFADSITAAAQGCILKKWAMLIRNIARRIHNMIMYR